MFRVAVDAGHGLSTPGKRCPDDSMREFHFNAPTAQYLAEELAEYTGVITKFTHDTTGLRDIPLAERVETANDWKADVFVSIHANAYGTNGWNDISGIETYTSASRPSESVKLAINVQGALIDATKRKSRGVKAADFYVVYKTDMTAILTECGGFMTNKAEAALMKTDAYRRLCAKAIATGIVRTYGLVRRVSTPEHTDEGGLYRVQTGAFGVKENAERLAEELRKLGYETVIKRD